MPQVEGQEAIPAQVQNLQQADISGPRELILIDAGVENAEQLLEEVLLNRSDTAFEVRVINGDEGGVAQISAILAEANGQYDAIHIVSHGNEGEVNLGNSKLTADNLSGYANDLAGWAETLTGEADICLLYTSPSPRD